MVAAIASRLEAIAIRLEAIASRCRPSLLGGGHRFYVEAIASRFEAIATMVEATASRLEAIAIRLEATAFRMEAIAIVWKCLSFVLPSLCQELLSFMASGAQSLHLLRLDRAVSCEESIPEPLRSLVLGLLDHCRAASAKRECLYNRLLGFGKAAK